MSSQPLFDSQQLDAETVAPPHRSERSYAHTVLISETGRSPEVGTVVGEYVIESEIARGGMGIVFAGRHLQMGRRVAIKMLLLNQSQNGTEYQRFAMEAEAAAKLDHPGIVPIYEVGEHHGEPFLVMKLIEGDNLAQRLHQGPLPIARAINLVIQVADAISHAHDRGVIHRDLKPGNILLDCLHDDHAVITDFGIAKCLQSIRSDLTSAGEPIGTPHFMPPEQADRSRGSVGPAADIYSVGAVLYAALTGRPPFQAASAMDVVMQLLTKEPVRPKQLDATMPATLDAIVMKCLEKEPSKRYGTAADLAQDLKNYRDGKPTIAKPMGHLARSLYMVRRHVLVATVSGSVVMLLCLGCLGVAVLYVQSVNERVALQQQLLDANDVLTTERRLFRSQLSRLQSREVGQGEFDAGRLADYAEFTAKANPELTTRLSLEALKLAHRESIEPQPFCVEWLEKFVAEGQNTPLPPAYDNQEKLQTLISAAEQRLHQKSLDLKSFPLQLYGLASDADQDTPVQPVVSSNSPLINSKP